MNAAACRRRQQVSQTSSIIFIFTLSARQVREESTRRRWRTPWWERWWTSWGRNTRSSFAAWRSWSSRRSWWRSSTRAWRRERGRRWRGRASSPGSKVFNDFTDDLLSFLPVLLNIFTWRPFYSDIMLGWVLQNSTVTSWSIRKCWNETIKYCSINIIDIIWSRLIEGVVIRCHIHWWSLSLSAPHLKQLLTIAQSHSVFIVCQ